jgi:hypothetical protein
MTREHPQFRNLVPFVGRLPRQPRELFEALRDGAIEPANLPAEVYAEILEREFGTVSQPVEG